MKYYLVIFLFYFIKGNLPNSGLIKSKRVLPSLFLLSFKDEIVTVIPGVGVVEDHNICDSQGFCMRQHHVSSKIALFK